jgi:hypothetical protein
MDIDQNLEPQRSRRSTKKHKGIRDKALSAYDSSDSILQEYRIEIYQQAEPFAAVFKIRKQLCLMYGQQRINGFELYDKQVIYEQIDSIAALKHDTIIDDGKRYLLFHIHATFPQFV